MLLDLVTNRCGKASLGHTDEHRWLFPGGLPGQALHPQTWSRRLTSLGILGRIARNTALMENAAAMPAVVLIQLLGLSITGAMRSSALASANAYAADITHRTTGVVAGPHRTLGGESNSDEH